MLPIETKNDPLEKVSPLKMLKRIIKHRNTCGNMCDDRCILYEDDGNCIPNNIIAEIKETYRKIMKL